MMTASRQAVVMLLMQTRSVDAWNIVVVANVQAEPGGVDVAVAPEEERTEDGLGHDVEDTVEDGLGVGGDDVAALAETPGDRVHEPEEHGPAATDQEGARDVFAESGGVLACHPDHLPEDEEEGHHAEDEVSPLVGVSLQFCACMMSGNVPCKRT